MAAAIPIFKLITLVIKTISKPIASRIKMETANHPKFYDLCVNVGQKSHIIYTRLNVFSLGLKFVGVQPLPREEAMHTGVNTLSEVFVFAVAVVCLIADNRVSDMKNTAKAAKQQEKEDRERSELNKRFEELHILIDEIDRSLPLNSQGKLNSFRKQRIESNQKSSS